MINTAKVKGRMAEKEETMQSLAPKIPCSPYTLGQQIGNKKQMTITTAEKLAEILGITDEEFPEFFLHKKLQ